MNKANPSTAPATSPVAPFVAESLCDLIAKNVFDDGNYPQLYIEYEYNF